MIKLGDNMIAAVPGGADSVCLLHLLVRIGTKNTGFDFGRFMSIMDCGERKQIGMQSLRKSFPEPCCAMPRFHADVRGYAREHSVSEEEAGRILRYQLLEQEARKHGRQKLAGRM